MVSTLLPETGGSRAVGLLRLLKARLKVLLKVLLRLLKACLKVLLKVLLRLLKARLKVLLKVLIGLLKDPAAACSSCCGMQLLLSSFWTDRRIGNF